VTVKLPLPEAVPPDVITDTLPVTAPGMTMPTRESLLPETSIADTPPMVKAVGLLRLVPVMVTNVPTGPLAGLKDVMVGTCEKAEK
jgi:hypothetical protein